MNRPSAFAPRIWLPLMLVVSMTCPPAAHAQRSRGAYKDISQLPDTPAGKRVREIIDVLNSNDAEKISAYVEEAFNDEFKAIAPMEMHVGVFKDVYANTGGVDFHSVRQYVDKAPDDEIVAIVKTRTTDMWRGISLNVESAPPHRIAGLNFSPARPPSDLPKPSKLTQPQLIKELEAFLDKLTAADAFSGSVLLAKDGKVLFQTARGEASKRFHVPNRVDTKFNLGSMNKMFTGVAVAQLVQRGKLSLDDSISKYVSTDWLPREMADKIQVKHLLTHTSGLGSYFTDEFMNASRARFRNIDDYKPIISKSQLAFEPGTDWQYSNTGMFLAGVVVEHASGMGYHEYIRKYVTGPAGMTNTDCYEMDQPVPNLAIGYSRDTSSETGWTNNLYKHVIKGGPAGGGFSTVVDLLKFDVALRAHKLLDAAHTEMVWTGKPELNSPDYGFGFGVSGTPESRIVGHSGGFDGISSNLDMFLDSGYTVAVMSNYDGGAMGVAEKIKELLGRLE